MSLIKKVTESGIFFTHSRSDKRNLVLTNSISLVVSAAPLLLIAGVLLFSESDADLILRLFAGSILFITPLILNRVGLTTVSRIALCWLPPIIIFSISILDIRSGSPMSASSFVGLRLFMVTVGCFPFLVFNLREGYKLAIGLSGSMLGLIFFDRIFLFFDAPYWKYGSIDPLYAFNNVRAMISYSAIALSCYFLKRSVEQNELINESLLGELETKNKLIREQANNEVYRLNEQLTVHIKQLQEREFSLNQSQKIAKIGSWEYTIKDAWLFFSDEVYNIFGLDKDYRIRVENLSDIFKNEDSEILTQSINTLLTTGESFDLTLRAHTPLGRLKWVRINSFPVLAGDRIIGARGVCHDITYFREADEMLRISENKYRSLFEQASDFIFITDFNGNFVDVNVSMCEAFGYTRSELLSKNIALLMDSAQLKGNPIRFTQLSMGEHILAERPMLRNDGSVILVEANVRKIQDALILVIARDITEIREAQRQVSINEALFRSAFEDSAIGMALVSPDYQWIKVNPELCQITGYSEAELLGASVGKITYGEDSKDDFTMFAKLLSGERESYQREKRYLHKRGSVVWANINASVVRDTEHQPMYVVAQIEDITERKISERQLAEANKTIGELKLMALRAVMSPHFIFNVLNSIQYYITKSDRYNAINYLSMFSRLIRTILNQSVDTKIRLSDEVEMLTNYIKLEMTRFENKFNYFLLIDPKVEADSIQIPSLLIQPYVENALLHGLYNKKEKGTLSIRVRQEEEMLVVEIEDDGIGRAAAMEIREQNFPAHQSMGIRITEERLKLINQEQPTAFVIEDLKDGDRVLGTRVTVRIMI